MAFHSFKLPKSKTRPIINSASFCSSSFAKFVSQNKDGLSGRCSFILPKGEEEDKILFAQVDYNIKLAICRGFHSV